MHLKQVLFLLAIYSLIIREAIIKSAGPGKSEKKETVKKSLSVTIPPSSTQGFFRFYEKERINVLFTWAGHRIPYKIDD